MSGALRLAAPAKVNLFLRVLAREEDGFHQLETLFLAIDLADRVTLEPLPAGVELEVVGDAPADPRANLAARAAVRFFEEAGVRGGVRILLEKRVPSGAGLGGGSSDAGTVLRGVSMLYGEPLPPERLLALAAELGSDVPFFAAGACMALAWGRGERLLALAAPPPAPLIVAVPRFPIATAAAYGVLAEHRANGAAGPTGRVLRREDLRSWEALAPLAANDFEAALFPCHPELPLLRDGLRGSGARVALLSGSGSAVFGVYPDEASRDGALAHLTPSLPATLLPCRTLSEAHALG